MQKRAAAVEDVEQKAEMRLERTSQRQPPNGPIIFKHLKSRHSFALLARVSTREGTRSVPSCQVSYFIMLC